MSKPQAIEIYNDVLFQFRGSTNDLTANNTVSLYNWKTGDPIITDMEIQSGHANAVQFSNTKYNESDEFPIIYCGDWIDSIVHVNRITRSSSENLYNIVYSGSGYHPNPAIDFNNKIMYTIGYYLNSTTSPTGNHCILSKWDISGMTDNGNGTFTPSLVSSTDINYINVMQDLKFHNGHIWICSGYSGTMQKLIEMDTDGSIIHVYAMPFNNEIEGLAWLSDNGIVSDQSGNFYQLIL